MNKTLTIFGACILVAGSLALNMIRYPVVWEMTAVSAKGEAAAVSAKGEAAAASPKAESAAASAKTEAAAAPSKAETPVAPTPASAPVPAADAGIAPVAQPSPSQQQQPVSVAAGQGESAATFAIERLPKTDAAESPPQDHVAFSGVEQPPAGRLVAPVAPPPPNAVPLGLYGVPTPTPAAAASAAAQAAADPNVAVPSGRAWTAETSSASFALAGPPLRPLGDGAEPRRLQPVDPVSPPQTPSPAEGETLQRLPPVDFAVAPPAFDVNSPLPDGTVPVYPQAKGR